MKAKRPVVKLAGGDGNAYAILGACKRAARKAGWSDEKWMRFREEATTRDYDHLLQTVMRDFEVG